MHLREIVMRCAKARIVSWLTITQQGVILPTADGSSVVIAVYANGRYVKPELVRIPDSPADIWGPDGPGGLDSSKPPQDDDDSDDEGAQPDG